MILVEPDIQYIEDPQAFRQTLLTSLNKLMSYDTHKKAVEELRDLFTNQIRDTDRINGVLKLICDTNEHQNSVVKKELIKVIIILAEVFEDKLIKFSPKILAILIKRLREDDAQLNSACAETIGAFVRMSLKGMAIRSLTDMLATIFKNLIGLLRKSGKYTQIGAAMCITKIVQTSPVECILDVGEDIMTRLIEIIKESGCKARLQIMEALLSITLATEDNSERLKQNCELLLPVAIEGLENPDWNYRKLSIEIIYTFNSIATELVNSRKTDFLETLNELRFDKTMHVRDVAKLALNAIDGGGKYKQSERPEVFYTPQKIDDSPDKSNEQNMTFEATNKRSAKNSSPNGRLKVNEKFFEEAPRDGEIMIKVKSPPKKYSYADEEESNQRQAAGKRGNQSPASQQSTPAKPNPQSELTGVVQQMMNINNNQTQILNKINTVQSNSKNELNELKNRVVMLEGIIQKLYQQQQQPPQNTSNHFQSTPFTSNGGGLQIIPQGKTIIYGPPQNMSGAAKSYDSHRAEYPKYDSAAKNHSQKYNSQSPKKLFYNQIEELLEANQIDQAYETCLLEGDDSDLIRLMEDTGVVIDQLDPSIIESLLLRIRELLQNRNYFPILLLWIDYTVNQRLEIPGPLLELIHEDLQIFSQDNQDWLDSSTASRLAKCLANLQKRKSAETTLY